MLNFGRIKWALRKIRLPVSSASLVLDVGSGGKPYPRSDVLLDRLTGAEHRQGSAMLIDRPTVFGDACRMPFKDKSFDYVVASHILEHMSDPAKFLEELQRVGRAGYIETPNFIYERLKPFAIHCLEVANVNGILHIHKKSQPVEDSFMGSLDFLQNNSSWARLFYGSPDLFHVRYFWDDKIVYRIHNHGTSTNWIEGINENSGVGHKKGTYISDGLSWRAAGLAILASINEVRRKKRLSNFDISSLLACPECRGNLMVEEKYFICASCCSRYSRLPHPDFTGKC
jgi:SAM-dependent methyltransferase